MTSSKKLTTLDLPYKSPSISKVTLPTENLLGVYNLPKVPSVSDLDTTIEKAIKNPIGTKQIIDIVKPEDRVAVIVDDITRPTPTAIVLPTLLRELYKCGIEKSNIVIVIALGSHRPMTYKEIAVKVGKDISQTYNICQSRFDDPNHLVLMGKSEDGVDIYIEEEVAKADIKIGVGSIVPHGAVGWSGGGKIIYPGVAGKSTVTQFHFTHGLTESNLTGQEETIVRSRMEKWVDIVGLDFIVNCVLSVDAHVTHVVAGHYIDAHRAGVKEASKVYVCGFTQQSDIVISVSYPHDHDFWQAAKGFYCAEPLVRQGGSLLLATPCPEGLGIHANYPMYIGRNDNKRTIEEILLGKMSMPEDPIPLAPAAMMAKMKKKFSMYIVSPGIQKEDISHAGIGSFPSIQEGIDALLAKKPDSTISLILSAEVCLKKELTPKSL